MVEQELDAKIRLKLHDYLTEKIYDFLMQETEKENKNILSFSDFRKTTTPTTGERK